MDRRQRTGYLVLAVVLAHVILISSQVNAAPGGSVLETVTFGVFAEVQAIVDLGAGQRGGAMVRVCRTP